LQYFAKVALIMAAAVIVVAVVVAVPADASNRHTCSYQSVDRGTWTPHENKMTVACFAKKYGVSPVEARAIAFRESRYNERTINYSSMALGLYQHLQRYWGERVRHYSDALTRWHVHHRVWTNPRAQAVVTMKMVAQYGWCVGWC
jgi:hypothetical protein